MMRLFTIGAATLAAMMPACAAAAPNPLFATPALSDAALALVSGTASPYVSLTRGNLLKLVDAQTRTDFRQTGTIGRVQMDVWWGSVGSELVANAVRGTMTPR